MNQNADPLSLDEFEILAKKRRAIRHFKGDSIPEDLLRRVLDIARWAPSGYNLQPTHFVVVSDLEIRKELRKACFNQPQVEEAPVTVVFTGDRDVVENNLERVVQLEKEAGAMNEKYEGFYRKYVGLAFDQGPIGLGWLGKALISPLLQIFKPVPSIPAIHKRYWLTKQVLLSAMNFMLGATAAGLATVPMEGFDEGRVRKVLNIPCSQIVPVVIPIGYADNRVLKKSRLPLEKMIHRNRWG